MVIDLKKLIQKYKVDTKYIVHAGAHIGQELALYDSLTPTQVWLFEPQKDIFERLIVETAKYPWSRSHNVGLGAKEEKKEMFISEGNEGQSSSFLKPTLHLNQFDFVKFNSKAKAQIQTLDSVMVGQKNFVPSILCMDTQGYELEILKGASQALQSLKLIVAEMSTDPLYEGCPVLKDLDAYLSFYGFTRVETVWQGKNWGDAAYYRP